MNDAVEAYFGKAAPWLEKEMAAGRADGKYAIGSDQLASTIVPAVQAFFAVRDAALAEAGERAGAARDAALTMWWWPALPSWRYSVCSPASP